jgi:hypothetical protein
MNSKKDPDLIDLLEGDICFDGIPSLRDERLSPEVDVLQLLTDLSEQFPHSHEVARLRRSFVNFEPFEL